ncbi:MAG TPA: hypothetical protein VM287_02740 [Egibacteraceae bacterium]|jgi:hypothetical protein|nr:hypothetical protein [Egibacteraceae bacterium]
MSEQPSGAPIVPSTPLSIDQLAQLQNTAPVRDVSELGADIWDSDEELDAFLADLRASRHASLS